MGIESKVVRNIINRLVCRGCVVRCASEALMAAAVRVRDPQTVDDVCAVTVAMVEEAINGCHE